MLGQFETWTPADHLGNVYDIEKIEWGEEISFTLMADRKRNRPDDLYRFRLAWKSSDMIVYQVTDETYRADCWGLDFEKDGRFYISRNSDYIENFKKKSPLFPDYVLHFLIIGTDTIIDVLAKTHPEVDVL